MMVMMIMIVTMMIVTYHNGINNEKKTKKLIDNDDSNKSERILKYKDSNDEFIDFFARCIITKPFHQTSHRFLTAYSLRPTRL